MMAPSDYPRQSISVSGELHEAKFSIAADSGEILACNDAAANLLGMAVESLPGTQWTRAIVAAEAGSGSVLAHAVQARRRVTLPPLILRRHDGTEIAVTGMLSPAGHSATFNLLLWHLLDDRDLQVSTTPIRWRCWASTSCAMTGSGVFWTPGA
jgi:hypothetical protein